MIAVIQLWLRWRRGCGRVGIGQILILEMAFGPGPTARLLSIGSIGFRLWAEHKSIQWNSRLSSGPVRNKRRLISIVGDDECVREAIKAAVDGIFRRSILG
jgi:hypothetical protein